MTSQALRDAHRYEEAFEKTIAKEERPAFHLSPRVGWMNDPNGFSVYKGEYHMFYQYHPYDSHWGPMHWGHAVSTDLLHWTYLPAAMAPDEVYDRDGCFSGSAIELEDGRQLLMYTGVVRFTTRDGGVSEVQTQCLAVGDGVTYEKYEGNPVLTQKDLPEGASPVDFRDPKMWKRADGTYRCVTGSRPADGSGQILLFGSEDGFHWSLKKVLAENKNRYGKMWECPDFFSLDGKQLLLTSPQDMLPDGFEYHNGNGTLCIIGSWDEEKEEFTEEANQAIDYGIDFYAPQTILTPDGRRVMIGWMQNWDTCNLHREGERAWYGQMSLPRELFLKDGRLWQRPVRELDALHGEKIHYENVSVEDGVVSLEGVKGRRVDLDLELAPGDAEHIYQKFAVRFAQNEKYQTAVSFRPHESTLKVDRKFSGSRRAIIHQRRCLIHEKTGGYLKLRLILDRYSVEVFANDGEYVMSAALYTEQEAEGISFFADGKVKLNVTKYDIL